ncbi:50S ribosomal protein L25 [Paenibacillus woosongensis]|uniref:Large ribosomal subunit protein bL25 n=1 Tax=Paenibacillus woosongensis TaxID=307580 RepID=A0A7X2YXZ4_9BACL|nr:50S ribosomal protein L25 [Paenibacillus woosongensis]MUG43974.1 50S ribosomal protein L25 [Paenibacillus woosongensis]
MRACFAAEQRSPMNRSGLKRLRQSGRLPGVVMGLNKESDMIHISSQEFHRWVRGGGSGLLEVQVGGSDKVPVLLEGLQRDAVTREYIHVDFLRVKKDELVRTRVTLDYVGTPKGTKLGGIVQTQSTFIEVEALPHQLPSSISVDISELDVGDSLLVGNIELPPEVTLLSSENELLVSVVTPRIQSEDLESQDESAEE